MAVALPFDPVERAGESWEQHFPDAGDKVYAAMRAVTSVMRAHQVLLAALDAELKPFGLNFSRYEALVLLTFSRNGSLPLSKVGERLQVHATSVTNVVDRLSTSGFVRREPNPLDGRGTLAVITPEGRRVAREATETLHGMYFGMSAVDADDLTTLFRILRVLRVDAGDFTE